ncbi:MAG: thioredoxin-like domain-containing protein [Prevotella sp.]|jgi:peroxiredoxin
MKIRHSALAAIALLAILALASCSQKKFKISGNITEAKDSLLYLEHMSLDGPVVIDSVKLGADGAFSFEENALDTITPEFYRLRIARQVVNIAIDSTEQVGVKAAYPTMSANYEVSGSDECKRIQQLAYMQITLQNQINAAVQDPHLGVEQVEQVINGYLQNYKQHVKTNYIFKAPMLASSYFALFQTYTLGGRQWLIFNPSASKEDVQVYGAVATSWDTYYPGSERGLNLHNIAIEGMKNIRILKAEEKNAEIDASKVSVTNLIDISLLDNKGVTRKLSDLKGKVVLLDFHLFGGENSQQRIMWLRDIYNKYHARGFEIYQVSYDDNEHFWKTQTAALPWISVFRGDGSSNADTYVNATGNQLPCMFLLDRESNVIKGAQDLTSTKAVDDAIKAAL